MSGSGRIVCFGEVLLRLSAPAGEVLLQSPRLELHVAGAEANVAVSLARFGHPASMVSVLPDNPLGRSARDELRRHGVDTAPIRFGPGRMGLYFLSPGAVLRPSEVTYDRTGSAFAAAEAGLIDWDRELAGAAWLHLSGVTPAVGPRPAEAALAAVRAARRLGVRVSFDANHRAKLWAAWNSDAPTVLRSLLQAADLAFANDRDMALVLGRSFNGEPRARRQAAAEAALAAFPNLERIASTVRVQRGAAHHRLSADIYSRAGEQATRSFELEHVVDRIGAGDAFAAGVLHGLITGLDDLASAEFGLAAAAMKHSIAGDFNLAEEAHVRSLLTGESLDVRR